MPQHAGEITYYDELGVARNAPPEEIRDNFRALARLLHPDQHTDPLLKEVAERQMRKLNRIYSVLSDPDSRRRYDDSLEEDRRPATIVFSQNSSVSMSRLKQGIAWGGALAVGIAILIWLAADGPSQPVLSAGRGEGAATAAPTLGNYSQELDRLRSDLRIARMERDDAVRQLNHLRGLSARAQNIEPPPQFPQQLPPPPSSSVTFTELPPIAKVPAPVSAPPQREQPPRPATAVVKRFGGFWFYTRSAQNQKSNTLYPPEFIEATISEQNGVLKGKYRARYRIVDRAIPPDVNFEFSGSETGLVAVCAWTGPGGSHGEITLKVTGENTMQADWTATQLGTDQGLISGTANLTRRID